MFKKNVFQKLAGLWLVGEVVNHVGLYGSKVAEGCQHSNVGLVYYILYSMDEKLFQNFYLQDKKDRKESALFMFL